MEVITLLVLSYGFRYRLTQAMDKPSPDVNGMVGPKVQIPVGKGWLPIDSGVQGAIYLPCLLRKARNPFSSRSMVNWI